VAGAEDEGGRSGCDGREMQPDATASYQCVHIVSVVGYQSGLVERPRFAAISSYMKRWPRRSEVNLYDDLF
jgi:hypothetical protein